jgi:glutamine synthetase
VAQANNLPAGTAFCDALLIDVNGNVRGKRIPAIDLPSVMAKGLRLCPGMFMLDSRGVGQFAEGIGGMAGDPDGVAWPLAHSLVPVPWARDLVQCVTDLRDAETGQGIWFDPRLILRDVVDLCRKDGLNPVVACELEFYLLDARRAEGGGIQPPIVPRTGERLRMPTNLSLEQLDAFDDFLRAVHSGCRVQAIQARTMVAEYGLGQFEINLAHTADPLAAADAAVLLRRLIKGVARNFGFAATFMSKPYVEDTGSGLHVHVSLEDEDGCNLLGRDGDRWLPWAVGGMQRLHAESMAIFAPNFSSYRRYTAGAFVPQNSSWGFNNRSVAFRVPAENGAGRRIEHRVAGADASPHLVLAAVLAAVHHGITAKVDPTPPVTGEVSGDVDPKLPLTFWKGLESLDQARTLPHYIPRRFLDVFAELKRQEARDLFADVLPVEYDFYL